MAQTPFDEGPTHSAGEERLDGWKEIAAYCKRDARTVQRWEKIAGFPIHRLQVDKLGTVYAFKLEVDAWRRERGGQFEEESRDAAGSPEDKTPLAEGAASAEPPQPGPRRPADWKLVAGTLTILLALSIVGGRLIRKTPDDHGGRIMLAVLPFADLSGDAAQEPIADGLTEEMITQLGRLQPDQLGVIARTTSMTYKKTERNAQEIGQELGVKYIVEGSVRRDGNRIRISAELIQVNDQSQIWAENYDRSLGEVLDLQADVARAIANQVQVKLTTPRSAPRPLQPPAFEAYLQGRFYWNKRDLPNSIERYKQAIALDPSYALAYAGLAEAYTLLGSTPIDGRPPREVRPLAKEAARKALELDATLDEAHLSLANADVHYDWDWPAAEREFRRALDLNPSNPQAHEWYSHYLIVQGRAQEALREAEQARSLDPLSEIMNSAYAESFYYAREYDRAVEQCQRARKLYPDSIYLLFWLGSSYREQKRYPEAIESFARAVQVSGGNPGMTMALAHAQALAGQTEAARKALAELRDLSKNRYVPAIYTAIIFAGLGDRDDAFKWLERALQERTDRLAYLVADPLCDPLRADRRFRNLALRIGLKPR